MRPRTLNLLGRNAEDIRPASLKVSHFFTVDVETRYFETGLGKKEGKRQSNITKSDDSNSGSTALQAIEAFLGNLRKNNGELS